MMVVLGILIFLSVCVNFLLICAMKQTIFFTDKKLRENDRFRDYFLQINRWLYLKQRGIDLEEYLLTQGIKTVVVYGMGLLGQRLCDDLNDGEVEVVGTVDRDANTIFYPIEVQPPEIGLRVIDVDAIIVTANIEEKSIREYLNGNEIRILYLKDILTQM